MKKGGGNQKNLGIFKKNCVFSRKNHDQIFSRTLHDKKVSRKIQDQNFFQKIHDQKFSRKIYDQKFCWKKSWPNIFSNKSRSFKIFSDFRYSEIFPFHSEMKMGGGGKGKFFRFARFLNQSLVFFIFFVAKIQKMKIFEASQLLFKCFSYFCKKHS